MFIFGGISSGRPVSNSLDICDPDSIYSVAVSCYELTDSEIKGIRSNHPTLSQQDLEAILEACSEPSSPQWSNIPGSPVEKVKSRVIDIEFPLSTTYLMSLAPSETTEESIEKGMPGLEQRHVAIEEMKHAQYLRCLQQGEQNPVVYHRREYWDQDQSMNVVVGIVILFLVIVVIAEVTEMVLKL